MTLREKLLSQSWTPAELEILRGSYVERGRAYVAAATGRSVASVCAKAARLGLARKPRWTDLENQQLRNWWGVESLHAIAMRLGRTRIAVFRQGVYELGLRRGVQDGQESLKAAARRTGYAIATLRRILDAAGVKLSRPTSEPKCRRKARWAVDVAEVDEAVAAWLATETVFGAARVRGIGDDALRALLKRTPGVPPKPEGRKAWRIPSAVIDRALASAGRRAA